MLIRKMKLKEIKPADYNPRLDLQPGDEEYEKLKRSIQEFSLVEPLVWNERTCRLVGGHQRLKVLEELGYEEVEVSVVDLPDEKEKALNVALNKIQGDWDYEKLEILLAELSDAGVDLGITGFDEMDEFLDIDIESEYTKKAETPVYEITGECPELSELVDSDRAEYLIQSIQEAEIGDGEKAFLVKAAQRHLVFDYGKIAEYYAHASPEMQELMEKSALVIIDFDRAIEEGYVALSKTVEEILGIDQ